MIRNLSILVLICTSQVIFAQIAFTNASDKLANKFVNSGAAIGVADMNGDGLDDIIRLHSTTQLIIDEQSTSGNFVTNITGINSPIAVWSLCIGDVDRNGGNDVFLGTANDFHRMAWSDDGEHTYTEQELNGSPILPQGSNMVDINNDGHLDLFVCNDNGTNLPYLGDGLSLTYDPKLIDTSTDSLSDNSGNYASIWVDHDNDGDQDLYISKCRLGVTEPLDPRRINQLFENDGNGNYTEVGLARGLVPYAQSWATDFGDIDNDGDLDVFIINHDKPSMLYENDGFGNYTDITNGAGFSPAIDNQGLGIQVKMVDLDNDGFLDILLTSSQSGFRCFRNNGNKTFTPIFSAFQTLDQMQSFALGDLNNDGFVDVIGGFGKYFNEPTDIFDKLFLNNGNNNNWLRVKLRGTNSNINGIGARVELHGSWGVMVREIRSGESYGISNALAADFGIGAAGAIEQLVIKWPSGYIETIGNPGINQVHIIDEGGCVNPPDTFLNREICGGEVFIFEDLNLTQSGVYTYTHQLGNGCDSIVMVDLNVLPSYNDYTPLNACIGEIIILPNGTESAPITADDGGIYQVTYTTTEGCDSLITLDVKVQPVHSSTESFIVCQGENYTWPDGTSSVILNDQSYTSRLPSEFNCDSLVTTSLNVIQAPNSQEYIEICKGENYTFPDGNTITVVEDLIYDISYASATACDSIANFIINLHPDYNIVKNDIACRGGNYTFPDGTAFAQLDLDFSYTSFLQTENGCDSTILINLSLKDGSQFTDPVEACQGVNYTFPDGTTQVIDQAFTQTSLLQNQHGCDSIIYTSITTKQSYQFTLSQMICRGDNYTFFDGTTELDIIEDLTHDSNFTTFNGCDSIITTALTVVQPVYFYIDALVCAGDSYFFPDGTTTPNIQAPFMQESTTIAASGCDSIIVTTIEVSPVYNDIINYTVCNGESLLIGDLLLENLVLDTVIVYNESTTLGCDSITIHEVNVDMLDTSISLDQATVTASAVDVSYQWLDCNDNFNPIAGATFAVFTPEADGDFQLMLEGPTGCIAFSECVNITGVDTENPSLSNKMKVYPNPAQDHIQVLLENEASIKAAVIYDINGKVVHTCEINDPLTEIDIEQLTSGLYLIRVDTENGFGLKRFVKL